MQGRAAALLLLGVHASVRTEQEAHGRDRPVPGCGKQAIGCIRGDGGAGE